MANTPDYCISYKQYYLIPLVLAFVLFRRDNASVALVSAF
jgi:hypothetical protein